MYACPSVLAPPQQLFIRSTSNLAGILLALKSNCSAKYRFIWMTDSHIFDESCSLFHSFTNRNCCLLHSVCRTSLRTQACFTSCIEFPSLLIQSLPIRAKCQVLILTTTKAYLYLNILFCFLVYLMFIFVSCILSVLAIALSS